VRRPGGIQGHRNYLTGISSATSRIGSAADVLPDHTRTIPELSLERLGQPVSLYVPLSKGTQRSSKQLSRSYLPKDLCGKIELWPFLYSLDGQRFASLLRFNLPQMIRQQYPLGYRNDWDAGVSFGSVGKRPLLGPGGLDTCSALGPGPALMGSDNEKAAHLPIWAA
jgi:hypothetical protein